MFAPTEIKINEQALAEQYKTDPKILQLIQRKKDWQVDQAEKARQWVDKAIALRLELKPLLSELARVKTAIRLKKGKISFCLSHRKYRRRGEQAIERRITSRKRVLKSAAIRKEIGELARQTLKSLKLA